MPDHAVTEQISKFQTAIFEMCFYIEQDQSFLTIDSSLFTELQISGFSQFIEENR